MLLFGPTQGFCVFRPAGLIEHPLARSLSSGFSGEGTALKLRKHLVGFGQLDLGEKRPLAPGFCSVFSLSLKGVLVPHPDQSSCLLNILKGDDGV